MQGSIAQMAALAIYGNEFLRGRDIGSLWPTGSVFRFCNAVTFVSLSDQGRVTEETSYAQDPLQWFAKLRGEGVLGLRLYVAGNDERIRDRVSVAFVGGGGRWLLEAVKPAVSDAWEARWEVGDRQHPERRIWNVTYGRTLTNHSHIAPKQVGEEHLSGELKQVLNEIAAFAERQELKGWLKYFQSGLDVLASENPLASVYHTDLAPQHALPLRSQQLLAVAQAAWVFGGMGSWNDLSFAGRDQEIYDRLSDRLFRLLVQAVVEGANSSFGG